MNQHTARLIRQKPRQRLHAPTVQAQGPLPETVPLAVLVRLLGRCHWRVLSDLHRGRLEASR